MPSMKDGYKRKPLTPVRSPLKVGAVKTFMDLKVFPEEVSYKIIKGIMLDELKEKYLSGFHPLTTDEKLDLSLDEIINPIHYHEEKIENGFEFAFTMGPSDRTLRPSCCRPHPGRLNLIKLQGRYGENKFTKPIYPRYMLL